LDISEALQLHNICKEQQKGGKIITAIGNGKKERQSGGANENHRQHAKRRLTASEGE
jgi:hypothetical protein